MLPRKLLAWIIGTSQLVLGFALLFIPDLFFSLFGFSPAAPDQKYLYGQLAARFLAFGWGMFFIARNLARQGFWWDMMLLIQGIDLAVGVFYSVVGGVSWSVSAFPVFNAAVFTGLLAWGRLPRSLQCGPESSGTKKEIGSTLDS